MATLTCPGRGKRRESGSIACAGMPCSRAQKPEEKKMRKTRPFILFGCLALLLLTVSQAQAQTAAQKFGRGLAGMTCGVLELPGNIVKETQRQGAIGVPIGLAYGLGMTVTRELAGVYEFLTAPFPVPRGFRPILRPEYPWDYFK
jgi:putative exosortase-associated protein (TIGR04073 family)